MVLPRPARDAAKMRENIPVDDEKLGHCDPFRS
jgi:hypothetical protein